MTGLSLSWQVLRFGGPVVYPLLALAVLAAAIIIDKAYVYWRYAHPSLPLVRMLNSADSGWADLERLVAIADPRHHFARFLGVILQNREAPAWWVSSRAGDAALEIESALARGLWVLETIVTAAPLLGLLGTIYGMIHAFSLFGSHGLVDPKGVTSGVAQALVATALGLLIALVALFGFNYFSRLQARSIDRLERIGSRLLDRARLERRVGAASP